MHRSRQIEHPNVDVAGPQAEAGISRLKAGRPAADKSYRSKSSTVLRPDGNRSQVTNLKQVCSLCLIWRLTHILDGLLVHQQLQRAAWLAWEHNIAEDWVRWETPVCECLQVPEKGLSSVTNRTECSFAAHLAQGAELNAGAYNISY